MLCSMINRRDYLLTKKLLKLKVDIHKKDIFGCNATHYANYYPCRQYIEIVSSSKKKINKI